jgi:hypothetical protein
MLASQQQPSPQIHPCLDLAANLFGWIKRAVASLRIGNSRDEARDFVLQKAGLLGYAFTEPGCNDR